MKRTTELRLGLNGHNGPFVVAGLALALSACSAPEVPADATWAEHVKPILAAKCVRCHGFPAIGGAPNSFRLDVYENTIAADGRVIHGAAQMAAWIQLRTDPSAGLAKPYSIELMPPEFISLTDVQQQTLFDWGNQQKWVNSLPLRGSAAGNTAPQIVLTRPLADSLEGELLTIEYELRDADGELVAGELRVGANATDGVRIGSVESGRGQVVWDVGTFPTGSYGIFAVVEDGSGPHELDLGTFDVTRAGTNTAPTVTVVSPNSDSVFGDAVQPAAVTINIADPDVADTYTLTVQAVSAGGMVQVDATAADPVGVGDNTFTWDTTGVAAGTYRIRATVNDGTVDRTTEGRPFIVSHETTTDTFADLSSLLVFKCNACHGAPVAPDLDPPNMLGRIYQRVVRQRNMPPESYRTFNDDAADPQLTDAERDRIGQWILAGAPGAQP